MLDEAHEAPFIRFYFWFFLLIFLMAVAVTVRILFPHHFVKFMTFITGNRAKIIADIAVYFLLVQR